MFWLVVFVIYSFIGWLIDSGYRSLVDHEWTMGNAFRPLPFSPIYGFGALMVILAEPTVATWPLFLQWFAYGGMLATFEGVSGPITTRLFGRPLWKYRDDDSFFGYTDLWHAAMWGFCGLFIVWVIQPFLVSLWP